MARFVRWILPFALVTLASLADAQITNVTNDQANPVPGVPHDYINQICLQQRWITEYSDLSQRKPFDLHGGWCWARDLRRRIACSTRRLQLGGHIQCE